MLEMSRRVGGAESRRQAQSVRSCAGLGWLDGGPVRSSIFVGKNREGPFLKNLPMFPAQEPAGGRRSFHRCSDRGRSLGPLGPWVLGSFWVFSGAQVMGLSCIHVEPRGLAREVV